MIKKAELIKVVNRALHRKYKENDLDNEIMSTLKDLSQQGNFLDDEFERKTIADRAYYSLPENFKQFQFIGLMSSDRATRYKPLVYERFAKYQKNIYYSSATNTPERYTWRNEFMYVRPTPDKEYIMFFFFSIFHPEKLTVNETDYKGCDYILFNNIYRKAIELRLCYEVALSLDLDDDMAKFNKLYLLDEIPKLKANLREHAKIIAYRDGF